MSEARLISAEQRIGKLEDLVFQNAQTVSGLLKTVEFVIKIQEEEKQARMIFEKAYWESREREREKTKEELGNLMDAALTAHGNRCASKFSRPMTTKQIAAWGTLLTTLMGGLGYIVSLLVK